MKKTLIHLISIFIISSIYGQSFQINISPDTLFINQGDNGTFNISVTPLDGFNASILLEPERTSCISDFTLSPTILNTPYNGQLEIGSTSVLMPGDYKIVLKGENGSLMSLDSCILHINYNPEMMWTSYNLNNSGLTYNTVNAIAVDTNNNIWVGVRYQTDYGNPPGCLAKFDRENWEVWYSDNHLVTDYCGQILSQNNNSIIPSEEGVSCIEVDDNNVKWIGTTEGLLRYDDENWTTLFQDENITAIAAGANNNIWVGTFGGGLKKYDGSNWSTFNTSNSLLPSNNISSISIQHDSIIWAGTDGGVVKYDGDFWTIYNTSNSPIPNNTITCVEVDNLNNVWVAPQSNGILIFDGNNWDILNNGNSGLSANDINTIFVDDNNVKWIGATKYGDDQISGLNKFDDNSWELFHSSNSGMPLNMFYPNVPNDLVYAINEDQNGTMWMGVWGGGLAAYDDTGLAKHFLNTEETINYTNKYQPCIYPNPSKGRFNITNIIGIAYIEVFNLNGQLVYKKELNNKNFNSIAVQLNKATKGLHIIKLIGDNSIRTEKIIIN